MEALWQRVKEEERRAARRPAVTPGKPIAESR
jgi:hypothetical protein